jgi:hypothetical protein
MRFRRAFAILLHSSIEETAIVVDIVQVATSNCGSRGEAVSGKGGAGALSTLEETRRNLRSGLRKQPES